MGRIVIQNDGENMKMLIKVLAKIVISIALATLVLSGFIYMYSFSGVHISNKTGATDYTWEPKQWKADMAEGFAWLSMDSNGYNNLEPIKTEIDVLMMGSSHMQAVNVPQNRNVTALLNEAVPEMYFYSIGVAGHKIYNVVNNISSAVEVYKPRLYVVIETSIVDLDEEKMEQVITGTFPRIKSYDTGLVYTIQKKVPLVKAIYKALDDWYSNGKNEEEIPESHVVSENYKSLLDLFLQKASSSCGDDVSLIICYHPVTVLNEAGELVCETDPEKLACFRDLCKKNNILFIDMTDDFQNAYHDSHVLPHGFINTSIGSGHLNEIGHRLIAERIEHTLSELPDPEGETRTEDED